RRALFRLSNSHDGKDIDDFLLNERFRELAFVAVRGSPEGRRMFAKVDVNGADAHPLYEYLKKAAPGVLGLKAIKWNFTKFLVDAEGNVVRRFEPNVEPASIEPDIEALLQ
ncbi:MAG: hypothetical protein ACK2UI_05745, partial [Anaerolineae bacterium]